MQGTLSGHTLRVYCGNSGTCADIETLELVQVIAHKNCSVHFQPMFVWAGQVGRHGYEGYLSLFFNESDLLVDPAFIFDLIKSVGGTQLSQFISLFFVLEDA